MLFANPCIYTLEYIYYFQVVFFFWRNAYARILNNRFLRGPPRGLNYESDVYLTMNQLSLRALKAKLANL